MMCMLILWNHAVNVDFIMFTIVKPLLSFSFILTRKQ